MSVGYPANKTDVDNRLGGLTQQLRDVLNSIVTVKAWADSMTDQDLLNLGYAQTDVNRLRSGLADLAKLAAIAKGTQTQATAQDFFAFAKWFVGVS
jgi:hypothetical protein